MKKMLIVVAMLMMVSSVAYAGSFPSPSITNFHSGDSQYNSNYNLRTSCVLYARWLQPHLPTGLNNLADKKRIINSSTAKKHSVAILDINGNIGHVAYVAAVDSSGKEKSITLYESNYPSGVERKRVLKGKDKSIKDIEKKYGIIGYWKP